METYKLKKGVISLKDEIKEILKQCSDLLNDDFYMLNTVELTKEELKKILDYITNLKEENEKKDAYIKYLEEYNPKYYKGEKYYGDGREDYKSRNEKAIEFIKEKGCYYSGDFDDILDLYDLNDLLNILNGGDEEC